MALPPLPLPPAVPLEDEEEMLPGDYVSTLLTQKSISLIIRNLYPRDYEEYTSVLVPLINEVFGKKYDDLRPCDPDNPRDSFLNVFNGVLGEEDDKFGSMEKDQVLQVAKAIAAELYTSIPRDYYFPPGEPEPDPFALPVCIIGAGAAGLYAGMILDSFGIKYEILEANTRVGGRIFTKDLEAGPKGGHDYFDVGAMRYPEIKMMNRTFKLFEKLKLRKGAELIPYNLHGPNNPIFFNNIHSPDVSVSSKGDYFKMSESKGGVVPDRDFKKGVDALLGEAYKPFKEEFEKKGNRPGWEKLSEFDKFSTRAYLTLEMKYSPETIEWCENMNVTAGLYDQAFTESVIRSMEFDKKDIKWWCIEGGSKVFIDRMVDQINENQAKENEINKTNKKRIITRRRVTSIAVVKEPIIVTDTRGPKYDIMHVQVEREKTPRRYSHVLSSVPLSCLRCINMSNAKLSYDQHVAIRSLGYDSSVKVGIKFRSQWWRRSGPDYPGITKGGYGLTDGIIGLCVYPSYGLNDPIEGSGVMIASYTLSQDARRMGALIQGKKTVVELRLIDLVLYDLAKLHNLTYAYLEEEMIDHYAHDWYRDENAMGAFALFGPGQFSNSYPSLLKPAAKGKLNFMGEAISRQHGWVSGSLNSAWRAVDNVFNREGDEVRRKKLRKDWGGVADLSEATLNLSVLIGTRGPRS